MLLPQRDDLIYGSTKTYTASVGLSTAFRQPGASSHCHWNHGYSLQFSSTFETTELDNNNWVVDFGGLKDFRGWLQHMFDHTTVVTVDDPHMDWYREAKRLDMIDLRVVPAVGCEAFALLAFERLELWLVDTGHSPRVWLARLEVREHEGNSAYVRRR